MDISNDLINTVKRRCGVHESITTYDEDVEGYISDAIAEMIDSGVTEEKMQAGENPQMITAVTMYVKAYLFDTENAEKYLNLFRNKTFRLTFKAETEDGNVE